MTKELRERFEKTFPKLHHSINESPWDLSERIECDSAEPIIAFIEQEIIEVERRAIEETITYISKHQGWEETEDNFRERFGFPPKYQS